MRYIPSALKAHLQQDVTTTCKLLRLELQDGRVYGMTTLDADVLYGDVLYRSQSGVESSVIATDTGLTVDNAEGMSLVADDESLGLTVQMISAGELDDAKWQLMLVNYRDLSMGYMLLDAGDTGNVTIENEDSVTVELISFAMRLRQKIGTLDSRTCRAVFGNPASGQLGCGVDADAYWITGTVTGVNPDDARRLFSASGLPALPDVVPGRVQWLTGDNSARNRLYQLEDYLPDSKTIGLLEQTPYDIRVGDTFRVRQDCDKLWATCRDRYDNGLNFKGEPYIPTGDGVE